MPDLVKVVMKASGVINKAAVEKRVEPGVTRMLKKGGAFLRTRGRSKLRRRKRVSKAGEPPSVHSKHPAANLRNLLWALDGKSSVVTGSVLYRRNGGRTVPNVMEFGGRQEIREKLENIAPKKPKRKGTPRQLDPRQIAAIKRKRLEAKENEAYTAGVKWIPTGRKKPLAGQPIRTRIANYEPRPYMGPALEEETKAGTLEQIAYKSITS